MHKVAIELEDLLYTKLKSSSNGELSFDEVIAVMDVKPEYGLRRISGDAIRKLRERPDVIQFYDERKRPYLKRV